MSVFKLFRVVLLLSVFFVILANTWMTEKRMAAWERPILVTVYPIAADEVPATIEFAKNINAASFDPVNRFMDRESGPYGFRVTPAFRFQVAAVGVEKPPEIPGQFDPVAIAWWSLKMRWWAWRQKLDDGLVSADIQMFVLYHSADGAGETGISVGMRKGRYGIVKSHAHESMVTRNLFVFTHEMLHVLGASDKYVLSSGEPIFPHGYAEPDRRPLFPQKKAEIMGGRIPINSFSSLAPRSLQECKIGRQTAKEIGFYDQLIDR